MSRNSEFGSLDDQRSNVVMAVACVALTVVIIVLCVLIWKLYHNDGNAAPGGMNPASGQEAPDFGGGEESDLGFGEPLDEQEDPSLGGDEDPQEDDGDGPVTSEEKPMTFTDVDEEVTAKELTNLRNAPGTTDDASVVVQLHKGEIAKRTGINNTEGWSRLEYQGQTLYAVNRLLSKVEQEPENEDDGQAPADDAAPQVADDAPSDTVTTSSGRSMTFVACDDTVSPKIEVNLRSEPSTDQGNDTIHYLIKYGEDLHRTGYSQEQGWSRIEYKGETLYAVTSYLYVVEESTE